MFIRAFLPRRLPQSDAAQRGILQDERGSAADLPARALAEDASESTERARLSATSAAQACDLGREERQLAGSTDAQGLSAAAFRRRRRKVAEERAHAAERGDDDEAAAPRGPPQPGLTATAVCVGGADESYRGLSGGFDAWARQLSAELSAVRDAQEKIVHRLARVERMLHGAAQEGNAETIAAIRHLEDELRTGFDEVHHHLHDVAGYSAGTSAERSDFEESLDSETARVLGGAPLQQVSDPAELSDDTLALLGSEYVPMGEPEREPRGGDGRGRRQRRR